MTIEDKEFLKPLENIKNSVNKKKKRLNSACFELQQADYKGRKKLQMQIETWINYYLKIMLLSNKKFRRKSTFKESENY